MNVLSVKPLGDLFVEIIFGDDWGAPQMSLSLDINNARILAEALQDYYQDIEKRLQANREMIENIRLLRDKERADKKAKRDARKKKDQDTTNIQPS